MRFLAIGGTGFIGRFTLPLLAGDGHEVIAFHRGERAAPSGIGSIYGDRRDLTVYCAALQSLQPEVVIDFLLSNERQATQLVDLFGGMARLVMVSSCDVYRAAGILHGTEPGEPDNTPANEDSPLRTHLHVYPPAVVRQIQGVYPWLEEDYDKIPAENAIRNAGGTVLRLPMVYGPGDPLRRFLPVVKRVDDGRRVIVLDQATADWRGVRGYVEDVAWGIALAAMDPRAAGRVYNIGDAENFTELEWRSQIADAAGFRGRIVVVPPERLAEHLRGRGNLRQHWAVDSSRIRRELGYTERVTRTEALARTIAWERVRPPAAINPAEYDYAAEDAAL
jgi:nucleoside-diphosphate-sugar epimerase